MKQYIGISRDHSGSMASIAAIALKDYNAQLDSIKVNTGTHGIPTVLSVIACSIKTSNNGAYWSVNESTQNKFVVKYQDALTVANETSYAANGNSTMLFDSIMQLIEHFEAVPDYDNPDVAFTIIALTDGQDNNSKTSGFALAQKIKQLQATDKWTIAFRVPKGYASHLQRLGIPLGNILEVDYNNQKEIEYSTVVTQAAIGKMYAARKSGLRSVTSFYADTSNLTQEVVRKDLKNITGKIRVLPVPRAADKMLIKDFVESKLGSGKYVLGSAHYEFSKKEKVQSGKNIIVWDKQSGHYYTGEDARELLNLPKFGDITLYPGDTSRFEIFIQSNSVNRKLVGGTKLVVMKD